MEFFILDLLKKRYIENFNNNNVEEINVPLLMWTIISSTWAAGISWQCHNMNTPFIEKLISAIFASMFANIYLILRAIGMFCPGKSIFM